MPNIDIPQGFPRRLRDLRTDLHLSETELADKAGLTYKTIRDLEVGKRKRVLEKTVLALAEALEISAAELLDTAATDAAAPPAIPAPWRRRRPVIVALAVLLVSVSAVLARYALSHAEWELERHRLTVRDALLGQKIWELRSDDAIRFCDASPWRRDRLLVGLGVETPDGGSLLCLERASGDTLWSVRPDMDALIRAFGEDDVLAANMGCHRLLNGDMDGDGTPEAVVLFIHGMLYPAAVCVVDAHGRRLSQYANKGHLNDLVVIDLDGDGRDEIIASGTNNTPAYQGATVIVLDAEHRNGASIDDMCNPWSDVPDSSAMRLIIPHLPAPYMRLAQSSRLHGMHINVFRGPKDRVLLGIDVRAGAFVHINVTLDDHLHPQEADLADGSRERMRAEWPDSLTTGTGPGDDRWLAQWLAGSRLFTVGQQVPASTDR